MSQQEPPVPPGWYPDPEDPSRPRWWDGTQWAQATVFPTAPSVGSMPNRTSPPSVVLTVVITALFGLLGLIPAALAASQARQMGAGQSKYWKAFGVTLAVALVVEVGAVVAVVLAAQHAARVSDARAVTVGTCSTSSTLDELGGQTVSCSAPHIAEVLEVRDFSVSYDEFQRGCQSIVDPYDNHGFFVSDGNLPDGRDVCVVRGNTDYTGSLVNRETVQYLSPPVTVVPQ